MITKQEIKNKYIDKIQIKGNPKKVKYYQLSEKLLQISAQFSGHDPKTKNYN